MFLSAKLMKNVGIRPFFSRIPLSWCPSFCVWQEMVMGYQKNTTTKESQNVQISRK